ncbi:hypothetical protein PHYSODRAFT_480397, partial [Phytophthora sojae]
MDIGSDRIRHYASGPVSAEVLGAAVQLCASANHYPNHQRKSQRVINRIQEYYFNSDYYVVRDDNLHGLKVNAHRVKTYKASLDGTLKKDEKVENIQLRYLSLHTVEVLDRVTFDHAWDNPSWNLDGIEVIRSKFKCDCKAFFQT